MPQVNNTEVPIYEEMPAYGESPLDWQDNPNLYPQDLRQNNTQNIPVNDRVVLTCLMWMFIFFSPGFLLVLCRHFASQIETFCRFTGGLGVAMLFVTFFVCASQQIQKR